MILLRILLFSVLFSYGTSRDLQLVSATSQAWSGGAPGSPPGVRYTFQLIAKKPSAEMKAEGLWIGEDYFPAVLTRQKREKTFSAHDTVYIHATYTGKLSNEDDSPSNRAEKPAVPVPFKYQGAALIKYSVNGKPAFLTVPRFETLKPLFYP